MMELVASLRGDESAATGRSIGSSNRRDQPFSLPATLRNAGWLIHCGDR
jgi:hypothetical protein